MATIQQLKDRVADFSNRTGLFSIQKIEFFLLFKDLIDKLKEAFDNINASSKQLTWQDPVVEFADLATTYPVPEKGWAVTVLSEGFVYSYNGSSWKNTGITALPDDMATADTVEESITARQELARSQSVSKSPVSKVLDDFANAVENTISGLQAGKIDKTAVKQVTGGSITDLMSQKAVSDMFEHLATNLNQAVADFGALVNAVQSAKVDKTAVKQVAGSSTTDLMSQKAVSDMFEHLSQVNLKKTVSPDIPSAGSVGIFVDSSGRLRLIRETGESISVGASEMLTYSELLNKLSYDELAPGASYLISDYQTVHTIPARQDLHVGPVEPIIVTAVSPNKLAPEAYSTVYAQDILYYDIENNQSKVPGCTKGYIYRRIDTRQRNDFPLDFRNVMVNVWGGPRAMYNPNTYHNWRNNSFAQNNQNLVVEFNNYFGSTLQNNTFKASCINNVFDQLVGNTFNGPVTQNFFFGLLANNTFLKSMFNSQDDGTGLNECIFIGNVSYGYFGVHFSDCIFPETIEGNLGFSTPIYDSTVFADGTLEKVVGGIRYTKNRNDETFSPTVHPNYYSTQPSLLPQKFGNQPVYERLFILTSPDPGNSPVPSLLDLSREYLPATAKILSYKGYYEARDGGSYPVFEKSDTYNETIAVRMTMDISPDGLPWFQITPSTGLHLKELVLLVEYTVPGGLYY